MLENILLGQYICVCIRYASKCIEKMLGERKYPAGDAGGIWGVYEERIYFYSCTSALFHLFTVHLFSGLCLSSKMFFGRCRSLCVEERGAQSVQSVLLV